MSREQKAVKPGSKKSEVKLSRIGNLAFAKFLFGSGLGSKKQKAGGKICKDIPYASDFCNLKGGVMKLMSKVLGVLLVSVFLWGTLGLDYVQARGSVGAIVVHVKGKVKVKRDGTRRFKKLKVNDLLFSGDVVKTWKRSTASIILKGGAEIRLNQRSKFEISKKGKLRQIIELSFGQLWTRMLHKMAKVNVKTPTAVCAIRGTEADIEERDMLTVKVYEGHVDVENANGKQSLRAGQMSTVAGAGAAPAAPSEMSSGDKGDWQEGIKVEDIGKYLESLNSEVSKERKLRLKIQKDGKTKEVEIKLKKK